TDGDGIPDGDEISGMLDIDDDGLPGAADVDMDGDTLSDWDELFVHGADVRNPDTEGDGIPDGEEVTWGLDPLNPADANRDADGDTLANLEEFRRGTDPRAIDTDGDGVPDPVEIFWGMNPASPDCDTADPLTCDGFADFDGDGIINRDEVCPLGPDGAACPGDATDPRRSDSDNDGLADRADTAPLAADRDNDGLLDGFEVNVVG